MPELPEVEIVRQSLNKKIKQKKVKKVIIRNRNLRLKIPLKFNTYFLNKKIIKVGRFSKYLIIYLPKDNYCLIHLGMSGTIHIVNNKSVNKYTNTSFYNSPFLPKKHNHVELVFENFKIIYNDPRRFGFFQLIQNNSDLRAGDILTSINEKQVSSLQDIRLELLSLSGTNGNINYTFERSPRAFEYMVSVPVENYLSDLEEQNAPENFMGFDLSMKF